MAASAAVLRYLEKRNCLAVVATHDQELLDMLETGYMNYHFTEHMEDGKITFDYKIHPGPANSQNAIRLLECMGFPERLPGSQTAGIREGVTERFKKLYSSF